MDLRHGILEKALSLNSQLLPDGIYNGRIGQSLLRLYASITTDIDNSSLREAATYLLDGCEGVNPYADGLLNGDLGFIWAIGFLVRQGVIAMPSNSFNHWMDILSKNNRYFITSPIRFNPHLRLYPFGMVMMSVHDKNSFRTERYIWEENIILRLNDCKCILTEKIPAIYSPEQLTSAHLHSICRFAQLAKEASVFPFRAGQILDIIQETVLRQCSTVTIDEFILHYLNGETDVPFPFAGMSYTADLYVLSYVGTISLMYDIPELVKR